MPAHPFPYEIIYSSRKTLAIQITADGKVRVRAPKRIPSSVIERFLTEKEGWVLKHLQKKKADAEATERQGREEQATVSLIR